MPDVASETKVHENLLRRRAHRRGFTLSRSRRRDPLAKDFGIYTLVDPTGGVHHSTSLNQIEEYLDERS